MARERVESSLGKGDGEGVELLPRLELLHDPDSDARFGQIRLHPGNTQLIGIPLLEDLVREFASSRVVEVDVDLELKKSSNFSLLEEGGGEGRGRMVVCRESL